MFQVRVLLRVLAVAAAATGALWPAAGLLRAQDAEPVTFQYGYDAAGRLVRMGDGSGRFVEYTYDPAGNLLERSASRRFWQVSVKKPAKGAWILSVDADGTVRGHGADDVHGLLDIEGAVVENDGSLTGTLQVYERDAESPFDTFTLAKSAVKADRKTGLPAAIVLKGSGSTGALSAAGARPSGAMEGFRGTYANAKNSLKAGREKANPGSVTFVDQGTQGSTTTLAGGLGGTLVRDAKGKAYGVVRWDGDDYVVSAKLKDGAKAVSIKSGKGAPVKLKIKVKR